MSLGTKRRGLETRLAGRSTPGICFEGMSRAAAFHSPMSGKVSCAFFTKATSRIVTSCQRTAKRIPVLPT